MKRSDTHQHIVNLTTLALLTALIILFTFTGIGYIPIGPLTLTILVLPVAIGACRLGPYGGLFLGGVFGLTSFITCFGMDATGTVLLGIDPFLTAVMCFVPRLLCGFLTGWLFKALHRVAVPVRAALSCLAAALLNTTLFLSAMWLFFSDHWQGEGIGTLWTFFLTCAGINALVEAAANLVIGGAIVTALSKSRRSMH